MNNERIPLTEMRLLNLTQFCLYTNIGRNNAMNFIERAGACIRNGNKVLVDRVKFDQWCDKQTGVIREPSKKKLNKKNTIDDLFDKVIE